MCVEPVDTKLKFKGARRELAVVSEAELLAAEIDESDVQHRTYQEAAIELKVLDGRDAPLAELIGNPGAQEALRQARVGGVQLVEGGGAKVVEQGRRRRMPRPR